MNNSVDTESIIELQVAAHEFIMELPNGWRNKTCERGAGPSGGQNKE